MTHLTSESGLGRALEKFRPLCGKRVALLEANGFDFDRLTTLSEAFGLAGAEVILIGPSADLRDPLSGAIVSVDMTLHEAAAEVYHALCIPGSAAAVAALRRSEEARKFINGFVARGKWIATLDHGTLLLEGVGMAPGRTVTSDPSLRLELERHGAAWVPEAVIADKRLVTAQGEAQLEAFVRVSTLSFQEEHREAAPGYH